MIEQLFGSKTRAKLLQLFFSNPNRSFYVREITRKIDEQINSVRRELANLLSIGIISSDTNNNRLYYEVNQAYEHYHALSAIFGVQTAAPVTQKSVKQEKTESAKAPENPLVAEIRKLGNVEVAVLCGQFTREDSSGIDVFLVGDMNHTKVEQFIEGLEKQESKSLNYSFFTPQEFEYRRQVNDRFVSNVLATKKLVLIDKKRIIS